MVSLFSFSFDFLSMWACVVYSHLFFTVDLLLWGFSSQLKASNVGAQGRALRAELWDQDWSRFHGHKRLKRCVFGFQKVMLLFLTVAIVDLPRAVIFYILTLAAKCNNVTVHFCNTFRVPRLLNDWLQLPKKCTFRNMQQTLIHQVKGDHTRPHACPFQFGPWCSCSSNCTSDILFNSQRTEQTRKAKTKQVAKDSMLCMLFVIISKRRSRAVAFGAKLSISLIWAMP